MNTASFESILDRDGKLVYKTKGSSMKPMLRENRDLVIIEKPSGRLKRYDVALYRRRQAYVLHRVIRTREQDYAIRGDNTYSLETGITDADMLGVLTAFVRDGHEVSVTDLSYRLYVRLWCALYPLRFAVFHTLRQIRRLRRGRAKHAVRAALFRHEQPALSHRQHLGPLRRAELEPDGVRCGR